MKVTMLQFPPRSPLGWVMMLGAVMFAAVAVLVVAAVGLIGWVVRLLAAGAAGPAAGRVASGGGSTGSMAGRFLKSIASMILGAPAAGSARRRGSGQQARQPDGSAPARAPRPGTASRGGQPILLERDSGGTWRRSDRE